MKKNQKLFVLWLLIAAQSVNAQLLNVRIGSDALVEDAIKDAVVIVESDYCILDTESNQKYGRHNGSYFNVVHFLGCRTDKGVITTGKAVEPWSVDKLFDKYRNDSKYRPLLGNTMTVRYLTGNKNESVDTEADLRFNGDSTLVCSKVEDSGTDGLIVDADDKKSVNWIVWIKQAADKKIDEDIDLEYSIVKRTIDTSDKNRVIETPNSTDEYLGALYVSAKVVSVGLVKFSLSGFIIDKLGKWVVEPVGNAFSSENEEPRTEVSTPENNAAEDVLTPMKGKKKKTKKRNKKEQ